MSGKEGNQNKNREVDSGEPVHRRSTKRPRKVQVNKVDLVCLLSIGVSIPIIFLSNIPPIKSETSFEVTQTGYIVQRESTVNPQLDVSTLKFKQHSVDHAAFHSAPRSERMSNKLPEDFNQFYQEKAVIHPNFDHKPILDDNDINGTVYTEEDFIEEAHSHSEEWYMRYYSLDDDNDHNASIRNKSCRRTAFYENHFPTCNIAHESPILSDEYEGYYFSSGTYRDAFSIYDDDIVLKIGSYQSMPYNYDLHEMIRTDANVMNQLSAHKQIVDLYAHCGLSLIVQSINGPNIQAVLMNYKREELIEDGEEDSLPDLWTPTQKLDMALKMAEALSLLHSHPGGVIVHGDVQFVQYLLDEDEESVVLSDFNRAEPLLFDESTGEYCKYVVGRGGGNVRAPEEYSEDLLDEKIDVYSFGPVLYSILTGNEPFVDDHHIEEHEVWPFVIKGLLPMVPSEIRGHSFAEAAMVAIMYKCFEYFPEKRIDIFTVISLLREAKALNDRLESIETSEFDFDRYNPLLMDPGYFRRVSQEDIHNDEEVIKYYDEHHKDNVIERHEGEDTPHYLEHEFQHSLHDVDEDDDDDDDYDDDMEHRDEEKNELHDLETDHERNDAEYIKDDRSELR